jgi:glutamyl-tRNA synthetase
LILKPDGNGKLSKRDADLLGFPVFAMDWTDPKTGDLTSGFKEKGFLPEAFINLLALLGWNDGSEQEIFSMQELTKRFSIDRVHKAGAKFDYEKAKWVNHEWIKGSSVEHLLPYAKKILESTGIDLADEKKLKRVVELVKDRCTLLPDLIQQASFFYLPPSAIDLDSVRPKWNEHKRQFFAELIRAYQLASFWQRDDLEKTFKEIAAASQLKTGDLLLPLRIMLVGGKYGPGVFDIAELIGQVETIERIERSLTWIQGG